MKSHKCTNKTYQLKLMIFLDLSALSPISGGEEGGHYDESSWKEWDELET